MTIDPAIMRLVWAVVEDTETRDLLTLPDTALVKMLLQQVSRRMLLNGEEVCAVYEYISSRTLLIRDMATYHPLVSIDLAVG